MKLTRCAPVWANSRCLTRLPLLLEGVGPGLLERHLSTDGEGISDVFLVELGGEGVPRLLAQALLVGRRGVSRAVSTATRPNP